MNQTEKSVNHAPLANVAITLGALQKAMERPSHLPGLVVLHGPSGWGKSTAAAVAANATRAYYVEARSTWTKKAFLQAILKEMGIAPDRTIYDMADQVTEQLALSRRPLIVDEMDHLVARNAVEILRDIYEGSGAAILMIGEEQIPQKLQRWERFHGRVLDWVQAQPADLDDARSLRRLYAKRVRVGDGLLERILSVSKGSVRRICVNLEHAQEQAQIAGLREIDLEEWGNRPFFDGEPARRRV